MFLFPLMSQFPLTFLQTLHRTAYNYFRANGFRDHLRDVPRDDIFQLDAPAAGTNFCEWVQVVIYVTPHFKQQAKPHSYPWFPGACAAVKTHRISSFVCTNRINLHLNWKSDRLVIVAKEFLKLPNLLMRIEQESVSFSRNLARVSFGKLLIVFSTKVNLLCFP